MRKHTKTCTWCKKRLDNEEVETPKLSEDNEVICDDCYDEEYMSFCPLCEDRFETPKTVEDGYYYLITEYRCGSDTCGKKIKRGIYKITKFPFFADGIIEGVYFSNVFKRIRFLTKDEVKEIKKDNIRDNTICIGCALKVENKENKPEVNQNAKTTE